MADNVIGKNIFLRHVESLAEKDRLKVSDRFGSGAAVLAMLLAIAFFLVHLGRPTGLFTEEFTSFAAFLFFAPPVLAIVQSAARAAVGRQNVLRPLEAGGNALSLISAVWLFIVFPFDFTHFAEPLPRFLEFTISWVSDGVAKFVMVLMIISFAALSIYTPLLYVCVRQALRRRDSGI